MNHSRAILVLLLLNLVDAVTTLVWVTSDLAPEANHLMAAVLDWGVLPFLLIKLGMGAFAAVVLFYGSEYKLARIGLTIALVAYIGAIGSHILTGFAVYGFVL